MLFFNSYSGSYHLVCNYFPYFRTSTNNVVFVSANPVTSCPAKFPMRDKDFSSLCTAQRDNYFDGSPKRLYISFKCLFFPFSLRISTHFIFK